MSINFIVVGPNRIVACADDRATHNGIVPSVSDGGPSKIFQAGRYSVAGCLGIIHAGPGDPLKERFRRLAADPALADSPRRLLEALRDEISDDVRTYFSDEWIGPQATAHWSGFCLRRKPSGEIDLLELRFPLRDRKLAEPEIVQHMEGLPNLPPRNQSCYCRPLNPIMRMKAFIKTDAADAGILSSVDFVFRRMAESDMEFRQAVGPRIDCALIDSDGFRWLRKPESAPREERALGSTNVLDWGNGSRYNVIGDLSVGIWIKLPSNAQGWIIGHGYNSSSPSEAFNLAVAGVSGAWNILYFHDDSSNASINHTFPTEISNDSWVYVGITRGHAAKTVTLYLGDGFNISAIGTFTYGTDPVDGYVSSRMYVGNHPGPGGGFIGSPNLIGTVEEHYVWSRQLTLAEHTDAMNGNPPLTNMVLGCLMGDNPEVDVSGNGGSGVVTGTTIVQGHN